MTFLGTSISSNELTPKAADKPLFLGRNVLEFYNAMPEWRTSGSWTSGADITSSATRYGFDGHGHLRTYPTLSAGATAYSYILDLVEGTDANHSFDACVVWNHNFHLLTGTVTVRLEISDNSDFTSATTLTTWTITDGDPSRLVSLNLNDNRRYTSARYVRLRITTSDVGGFTSIAPAFGELILARRRQMGVHPDLPWDPKHLVSDVADFSAPTGSATRYERFHGRRVLEPVFRTGGTDTAAGLITETEIRDFWTSIKCGAKPFVFMPQPTSQPNDAIICRAAPDLTVQALGPYEREFSLALEELAPFRQAEVE